jgi:hypothetical protein
MGNFNPVHHRSWNLAAIGLPRVNPRKQRRSTFTAKEMTTLLSKAEGRYRVIYFFCMMSEAVAIEIDKHIESDCSIVRVRQQREKRAGTRTTLSRPSPMILTAVLVQNDW